MQIRSKSRNKGKIKRKNKVDSIDLLYKKIDVGKLEKVKNL